MPKCSYAQNCEDVLLARALPGESGFYIDVGAADPVELSVTKYFYDLGWSGINFEPLSYYYDRLAADRPRDRNLKAAVADRPGPITFYGSNSHPGWSTTDPAVARKMVEQGIAVVPEQVPAVTLAEICERYDPPQISFLKIDVEGAEKKVLDGADFRRWRPRVVVIEATEQASTTENHAAWEPVLLGAEYHFANFDGLNRYYVRAEDRALAEILRVPVNVFDDWYPYQYVRKIYDLETENRSLKNRVETVSKRIQRGISTRAAIRTRLVELHRSLSEIR